MGIVFICFTKCILLVNVCILGLTFSITLTGFFVIVFQNLIHMQVLAGLTFSIMGRLANKESSCYCHIFVQRKREKQVSEQYFKTYHLSYNVHPREQARQKVGLLHEFRWTCTVVSKIQKRVKHVNFSEKSILIYCT